MTRLLLVRHGTTEFNTTRRFAGYSDIEMSTSGYRQVERLRDRLKDEKIDLVYSSDLRRSLATAEIILAGRKVDIVACPELREVNYGDCEGLTFNEISRDYPELARGIADLDLQMQFPGGENFAGFIDRTCRFLDRLSQKEPSAIILIVSHSGPLRTLICCLLGIDQSHWRQFRVDNASLSIVETYPNRVIISLLNGTDHLREDI